MDLNFDHQMSLSKSKSWYSNICLQFLKRAVPLQQRIYYNTSALGSHFLSVETNLAVCNLHYHCSYNDTVTILRP